MVSADEKYTALVDHLRSFESLMVAFSGGVDSTLLLYAAHEALGDKAVAATAKSPLFPEREFSEAAAFCKEYGIRQIIFETHELEIGGFRDNPVERCYLCKSNMLKIASDIAEEKGISAIAEGSNVDDEHDFRPGSKAVAEYGVVSPLKDAGLSKHEVRALSKAKGLATWNKPSFACLASRFAFGEKLTVERLAIIEKSERVLFDLGFHQVRVRFHGPIARIELSADEISRVVDNEVRSEIDSMLKKYGFEYVTVDLAGYCTGAMNKITDNSK